MREELRAAARRKMISFAVALPVTAVMMTSGTAQAVPDSSVVCSNQHLNNCPKPGLYTPAGDPVIFNDSTHHYRIVWVASYIVPPPQGQEPVWFWVYVFYENYGKQTLQFGCSGNPGSIKEWFYRDGQNIGYVPASTDSCTQHPNQRDILKPGHLFESYAEFNNVPWKGDKVAIEWPQPPKPHATSAFVNPYDVYRWAAASKRPSRGSSNILVKLAKLGGMIWQIVGVSNMVCEVINCKFVPPNVTKLISRVGAAQTIGDLASAVHKATIVGNDLSALNKAIKGHRIGQPYSAKVKALARTAWNDTRSLQRTLEDLVPGLSAIWPVPPPK